MAGRRLKATLCGAEQKTVFGDENGYTRRLVLSCYVIDAEMESLIDGKLSR